MNYIYIPVFTILIVACGQTPSRPFEGGELTAASVGDLDPAAQSSRFRKYLIRIEQGLSRVKSAADVMALADDKSADFRGNAYRLEALLKLYKKSIGSEGRALFVQVKAIEDAFGRYGESREAVEFAESVKAPEKVVLYLRRQRQLAGQNLAAFLVREQWIGSKPSKAQQMSAALDRLKWPAIQDDRDFFRMQLADEYRDLKKKDYSRRRKDNSAAEIHNQLENWTHEMRRDYRWPNIMMAAGDGLVLRDAKRCSIPQYRPLVSSPFAQLTYTKWSANQLVHRPVFVEDCLYLAFVSKIEQLGTIKDLAHGAFHLTNAFMALGIERNPERAMDRALTYAKIDFDRDVFAKTDAIEREVRGLKLIDRMANNLSAKQ